MKKKCTFSISDIDAGWFDISFEIEKEKIKISASDLWGNDSPKALLVMLTELLLEKSDTMYILFDEEPGTYIVSLKKGMLIVAYSKYDCIEMDQKKINITLCGNMTFNEISNLIVVNEILLQAEIDTKVFIQSVYKTFYKYANNRLLYDKYEENWNYFPCKEWQAFEHCVQQKGLNKRDL